jgi:5-formyltetrahydrofolate cyclo-ligase
VTHGERDRRPPGPPAADAPKAAWRAWAHEVRRAWADDGPRRTADELAVRASLAAWAPWRSARCALVYVPYVDEIDPLPPEAGRPPLATTRTLGRGRVLALHALTGELERHPFGFLQPRADAPRVDPAEVDLVLVPGLVFDRHGGRLGHGQGHYDRLLPLMSPGVPFVGIALDELVAERLPLEPHDVAVTHLLTPAGWRTVPG